MTLTRLEFFEQGYGLIAVKLGMMSISMLDKYDMYKTYLEYLEKFHDLGFRESQIMAQQKTLENCKCSHWTLRRARAFFEEGRLLQISVNGSKK